MKNLSVFINLVSAFLMNVIANVIINSRGQKESGKNYDFIQSHTNDWSEYRKIVDYMLYFIMLFAVVNYRHLPLYKIISTLSVFLVLRSISIFATSLHDCPDKKVKCEFSPKKALISGGCEDKMFSGHTIATLTLCYYLAGVYPKARALFIAYPIILSILIIVVRDHYTIDVLTAWALFYFYTLCPK